MAKLCVVGSLNMDIVINSPKKPDMGQTLQGWGFITNPGGKGANQAVAALRLGAEVIMAGRVGEDSFGDTLIKGLKESGADVSYISRSGAPTGVAVITVVEGDNYIILDAGANGTMDSKAAEAARGAIEAADMLLLQHEIPDECIESCINIAKAAGVPVMLNPAPAREVTDERLALLDLFTPNAGECEQITGLPCDTPEHAQIAAWSILAKGTERVAITLGAEGVVYGDKAGVRHMPAFKVKAVDTTAAGDAFCAALAVGLCGGMSYDKAVELASAAGALTVTKAGAQRALPTLKEVESFLSSL